MSGGDGCKVDAAIERYGLDGAGTRHGTVDEHLVARWRGEGERPAEGYRSLTEWFNRRLLKVVYDRHGRDAIDARLDSEYDVLTGDDRLQREELVDDLAADGIDGAALRAAMVSWSTMRNHLTGCLGAEKEPPEATTDWERTQIRIARDRAESKAAEAVAALASKGRVAGPDAPEVEVGVQVGCDRCPTRVPVEVAIERGYVCERHYGGTDP